MLKVILFLFLFNVFVWVFVWVNNVVFVFLCFIIIFIFDFVLLNVFLCCGWYCFICRNMVWEVFLLFIFNVFEFWFDCVKFFLKSILVIVLDFNVFGNVLWVNIGVVWILMFVIFVIFFNEFVFLYVEVVILCVNVEYLVFINLWCKVFIMFFFIFLSGKVVFGLWFNILIMWYLLFILIGWLICFICNVLVVFLNLVGNVFVFV